MEELYMSKYLKNKKKRGGEEAAESCCFSERGKRVAIFHLTANVCGVKSEYWQNVKKKRNERNYLFLTGEFISRTKRYTFQFVFSAVADVQCCQDKVSHSQRSNRHYVLVTQASITFHPAKITSRIVDFVFV
jgi:hypothetical protein